MKLIKLLNLSSIRVLPEDSFFHKTKKTLYNLWYKFIRTKAHNLTISSKERPGANLKAALNLASM